MTDAYVSSDVLQDVRLIMTLDQTLAEHARSQGLRVQQSGLSAEDQVVRYYERLGVVLRETRWRSKAGEVDLVFEAGGDVVFVEVKSSRSHAAAAARLSHRQLLRVAAAAEIYVDQNWPGIMKPVRVEAALVDQYGQIEIVENVLM